MKSNYLKSRLLLAKLFLLMVSVLITISCQKEETSELPELINYEQIGIEHNNGLAFILEQLKESNTSKMIKSNETENLFDLAKDATITFAKESEIAEHISIDADSRLFSNYSPKLLKSATSEDPIDEISEEVELSAIQSAYMEELKIIMSNLDNGLESTIAKIIDLEEDIKNNCNDDEMVILLIATSIGKNSLDYWVNNFDEWIKLIEEDYNSNVSAIMLKSATGTSSWLSETLGAMGKSDVAAGVIGGVVGSMAGGVGAVPGAIAGACYGSASRGIVALYDHWTE